MCSCRPTITPGAAVSPMSEGPYYRIQVADTEVYIYIVIIG